MRNPLLSRGMRIIVAACLAAPLAPIVSGQQHNPKTTRVPLVLDWTNHKVIFTKPANAWQTVMTQRDPRYWQQYYRHNTASFRFGNNNGGSRSFGRHQFGQSGMGKDWAVSLGAGGVAPAAYPSKYGFDVTAAPDCTHDFAVFPINASTGNTRASVVGTFTAGATLGNTFAITITPTGVTLTITAGVLDTGTTFLTTGTAAGDATKLAAAFNRNLSAIARDRIVAVASGATVTVYALTAGSGEVLTAARTSATFNWAAVTAGTSNNTQANIVAFNQLYSGSGTPFCGKADPEFTFSYASGVGPVTTSPGLSLDGTKISYVENDPNIGAILHVLTIGTSTEIGTCTNTGAAMPTCATAPVIPGSTAGSNATDFMLPLGLVAANAATGIAGAADSFSSPFTDYANDTTYVGDNNGFLYAVNTTFTGTPTYAGGNFPLQVSAAPAALTPSAATASATTATITVPSTATLGLGEEVVISGVTVNGAHCNLATANAMNGTQTILTIPSGTTFTFDGTFTATTGGGCNFTATPAVTPGSNYLSPPTVEVSMTGNIFVGDSSGNLYMVAPAGVLKTTLALGENINGGIRGGPIVDSTNSVGYAVMACAAGTASEVDATNAGLAQFSFTSATMTLSGQNGKIAGLDTARNQNCIVANLPVYDPTPDARYYNLGISSATAANNGELIAAASGSNGQQIKTFQFVSKVMQTIPEGVDKPQVGTSSSVVSPLTSFFINTFVTGSVTAVNATAGTPGVVTVTAANKLAANDIVTVSGVTSSAGCTAADATDINGAMLTVVSATSTSFTYDVPTIPSTTTASCTGGIASGGPDYMFMGVAANPTELYTFLVPGAVLVPGLDNPPTPTATNTTDVVNGTSGIVVDNDDSTDGQTASLYYGTLAPSTTVCGATSAYCAIKLTDSVLQ